MVPCTHADLPDSLGMVFFCKRLLMIKSNFMNLLRIAFFTTFSILVFQKGFGQASSHTISISNIKAKRGNLMIGWYNSEASYNERNNPIFKKLVTVNQQKEVTVVFEKYRQANMRFPCFSTKTATKKWIQTFWESRKNNMVFQIMSSRQPGLQILTKLPLKSKIILPQFQSV